MSKAVRVGVVQPQRKKIPPRAERVKPVQGVLEDKQLCQQTSKEFLVTVLGPYKLHLRNYIFRPKVFQSDIMGKRTKDVGIGAQNKTRWVRSAETIKIRLKTVSRWPRDRMKSQFYFPVRFLAMQLYVSY